MVNIRGGVDMPRFKVDAKFIFEMRTEISVDAPNEEVAFELAQEQLEGIDPEEVFLDGDLYRQDSELISIEEV